MYNTVDPNLNNLRIMKTFFQITNLNVNENFLFEKRTHRSLSAHKFLLKSTYDKNT